MRSEDIHGHISPALACRRTPDGAVGAVDPGIWRMAEARAGRLRAAVAVLLLGALGVLGMARADASADASDAPGAPAACESSAACEWVGTWATALTPASPFDTGGSLSGFANESIRMLVQTSIGGGRIRIRLSNAYGENDLTIGHASVGRPAMPSTADLDPRSVHELSFRGSKAVVIPAGGEVLSDPVAMAVAPLSQLAVTIYLPDPTGPTTWHWFARQTAFVYDGDHAAQPSGSGVASTLAHFYFLAGVEVPRERRSDGAVVVLGASISDGFAATLDANQRWPDLLARRIVRERRESARTGVLNLAVSGNAISHDGDDVGVSEIGASGLHRLPTDVYPQPGARSVIVDLGLNDIFLHDDPPETMIAGLRQIAGALHQHHLRVLFATLSPAGGSPTWSAVRETTRQAVNDYIRCTHDADGVVDVDLAFRDPAHLDLVNPAFDSGDHVHPNDLGSAAIVGIVPLWLL
jgi:lysophospholipase L1-like esterase